MNLGLAVVIIVGLLWLAGLFWGAISNTAKSFKSSPPSSINATLVKSQQQQSIEETEEKRRQLMDDMKQRISDGSRKY